MALRRRKPMERKPIKRSRVGLWCRVLIRRVNKERRAKLYARNFGPKATWIRSLACATCGANDQIQAAHIRSRGAGGSSVDLIPQCAPCHGQWHALGRLTFCARFGVTLGDLQQLAADLERQWQQKGRAL